tara:strand:+ start:155 stop:454 length:300 start_codon:yes stop_codon:yes gene_type:complete
MNSNIDKSKKKIKYFFIFIFLVFFLVFIANFFFAFMQNKVISLLNSEKFERFIILKVDNYLERMSDGELSEKEINYYSKILNKIYKKYKPVLDNLKDSD